MRVGDDGWIPRKQPPGRLILEAERWWWQPGHRFVGKMRWSVAAVDVTQWSDF